jgi:RNA polymerase sigma-70 factor (ECF subfamily)
VEDLRPASAVEDPAQRRDLILLERALGGDLDAFNDLVVIYQDLLFALVVRMVPDRDQASDCVQEAFFSAYRNLRSFRGGIVRSWLSRIAINAAMDTQRLRKRRPVDPYPELEDDSWQPPADASADPVTTALETYDYAEIAQMTGVSLGTVKSRIHRGRLALRALLADQMELFRG